MDFFLPVPPSVNAAYRNVRGKGRVKTQAYHDWLENAGLYLMQQGGWEEYKIIGAYKLEILLPEAIKGDIDNRIKLISDLLVSIGAVVDDKHAWKVSIERNPKIPENECYVEVTSIKTANRKAS